MIYIKRICKQDLAKEIAIPAYNAADAFDYDARDITLAPRDITMCYSKDDSLNCKGEVINLNIHVPGNDRGDEARFSKPLQNFLIDHGIVENDLIVFISDSTSLNKIDFYCIKQDANDYSVYNDILNQTDRKTDRHNHKLVTAAQQNGGVFVGFVAPKSDKVFIESEEYLYISAIKTKPFLILGGFSGTGKSQKVKELAFATCPCDGVLNVSETSPGNYLLVSVKPNWHDATDIIGFRSSVNRNYYVTDFMRFLVKAKQYEEQNIPFFVCLDEMNLAPVEEYFADFLSVIESRKRCADGRIVTDAIVPASVFNDSDYADDFNIFMKLGLELTNSDWKADDVSALPAHEQAQAFERHDIVEELKRDGLTIPSNVVIIGTVNMDDTTNSFSRKVIDRAMTFETIVGKFDKNYFSGDIALNYVKNPRKGELFLSDEVRATQMIEENRFVLNNDEQEKIVSFINNINEDLEGSPFKISFRILNETILLYRSKKRIEEIVNADGGFEDGVVFKTDLNTIFDDILMQKVLPRIEGDYEKCNKCLTKLSARAADNDWSKSYDKIDFMIKRFGNDKSGFTTFWN